MRLSNLQIRTIILFPINSYVIRYQLRLYPTFNRLTRFTSQAQFFRPIFVRKAVYFNVLMQYIQVFVCLVTTKNNHFMTL